MDQHALGLCVMPAGVGLGVGLQMMVTYQSDVALAADRTQCAQWSTFGISKHTEPEQLLCRAGPDTQDGDLTSRAQRCKHPLLFLPVAE